MEKIAVTAFSPLGAPSYVPLGMAKDDDSVLELPLIKDIAQKHRKTPAQIVLDGACSAVQQLYLSQAKSIDSEKIYISKDSNYPLMK